MYNFKTKMRIGIIGFGNMGSSLSELLCKNGYDHNIIISNKKQIIDKKIGRAHV